MFHIQKRIVYTFFSLFLSFGVAAQDNYRAVQWGLEDGLSQPETYFMLKDIKGFTWIGTKNGLNRFDGNTFKIYFHEDKRSNSLLNNFATGGLVEDSLHNIWIGNITGVSRYDIRADSFSNFLPDKPHPKFDIRIINPFWATKNEVLCVESEYLITAYDIHTSSKKILTSLKDPFREFVGPSAGYSIFDAESNAVWLLLREPGKDEMGLLEFSLSNGGSKFFPLPPFKSASGQLPAEAMRYDKNRHVIWINSTQGLLRFNLSDKKFDRIDALKEIESISNYNRFVGIELDLKGRVWLATYPKGILIYDPADQSVKLPFPDDSVLQAKISMGNVNIYCDRDGIIWNGFWSRNGIYQLLPFKPAVQQFSHEHKEKEIFGENTMFTAVPARDGRIWFGGLGGLSIFNSASGLFERVNPNDFPGIKTNEFMLTLGMDTISQKAWVKTRTNFFQVDIINKKTKPVTFKDSVDNVIPINEIGDFRFKPSKHEIVITSSNGKVEQVFLLDTADAKQILSFAGNPFDEFQTTVVNSRLIFLKGRDRVGNQSYQKLNGKWQRINTPMDSINWSFFIYNDTDSTYWVPANKQLIHFSNDFHVIRIFGQADGLPEIGIGNLVPDKMGNIWFHSEWAIYQLNNQTGQIVRLTEKDGYTKTDFELLPRPCLDSKGDVFFPLGGWAPGFFRIRPENFISAPSSVYFQSLQINQKPFQLTTGIDDLLKLNLEYFQNKIEIETGIIDYYSKGKSRLRYRLEGNGVKESWKFAPYYSTIRYDGLAPGSYRLVVQASNAANEFNGPEKVLLIDISPPFWETWWFRILAALTVILILYGIIQYRSRKLRQQNLQLEEKVLHRTKELKHSLEELRETQNQLIQSEKMASLGELTAGIAHEIQNPLNFMNNFSEVNSELIDELTDEVKKGNLDEVEAIAKDIKENEQKISHHGKRADAIVKSMMQHSRTSSGVKEPTDINALADEYLRLSYHGMRARDKSFNASLKTDFDPNLERMNVIPQDMGRVLLNLFNNAFYAVAEKKKQQGESYNPIVSVSTKTVSGRIEIRVKDNGNGIPQKVLDKIFQPFFTTKPTGEGTGLGLSLSYDIITKGHGGELKVDTKEGEWSEFIIYLH